MSEALPAAHKAGGDDHTALVTVRYWASIRSAAGIDTEQVEAATLADVLAAVAARHPDVRFADQLRICAMLIGSQPVGGRNPEEIAMSPGDVVEFLPPFAGG